MGAEHQREPGRGTDRLIAVRQIESQAPRGESVDVGRLGDRIAVTAERRFEVVHQNHQHVRRRGQRCGSRSKRAFRGIRGDLRNLASGRLGRLPCRILISRCYLRPQLWPVIGGHGLVPRHCRGRESLHHLWLLTHEVRRFRAVPRQVVQFRIRPVVVAEQFPLEVADREIGLRFCNRRGGVLAIGRSPPVDRGDSRSLPFSDQRRRDVFTIELHVRRRLHACQSQ